MASSPIVPLSHAGNWWLLPGQTSIGSALHGFNETALRDGCRAVLEIGDQGIWYPWLAARKHGKGRVTCWTTGASPHRGINCMKWPRYADFWKKVVAG